MTLVSKKNSYHSLFKIMVLDVTPLQYYMVS